jgi:hypothetical protein
MADRQSKRSARRLPGIQVDELEVIPAPSSQTSSALAAEAPGAVNVPVREIPVGGLPDDTAPLTRAKTGPDDMEPRKRNRSTRTRRRLKPSTR